MILAAGFGTRLRPLTEERPKALVEVSGRTLLEITLERLRKCGVAEVIVNVHHLADMIVDYLEANENFGMRVEVSREERLLDTGGGLKKAAWFFLEDPERLDEPFVLHNVDVLSTIDLGRMLQFHSDNEALVTLAVRERETSRSLLFDDQLQLWGWKSGGKTSVVRESEHLQALDFSGIHVISPRLFQKMQEDGEFSIIDAYLSLAAQDMRIMAFRADDYSWRDVGSLEDLKRASEEAGV